MQSSRIHQLCWCDPRSSTFPAFLSRAAVGDRDSPGLMFPAMDQRRSMAPWKHDVGATWAFPHQRLFGMGILRPA